MSIHALAGIMQICLCRKLQLGYFKPERKTEIITKLKLDLK